MCCLLFVMGYEHSEEGWQELSWYVVSHATVTSVRNSLALHVKRQWQEDWEYLQSLPWFPCWFSVQRDFTEKYLLSSLPRSPEWEFPQGQAWGSILGSQLCSSWLLSNPSFLRIQWKTWLQPIRTSTKACWEFANGPLWLGFHCGSSLWILEYLILGPVQNFVTRFTETLMNKTMNRHITAFVFCGEESRKTFCL